MKGNLIRISLAASIVFILSGCSGYMSELKGTAKPDAVVMEKVPVSKSYHVPQDVALAAIKKVMKSQGVIYEIVAGEDKDTVRLKTEPIVVQEASAMDLMLAKSAYSAQEIIDVSMDGTVSFIARFAKSWEGLGDQNTKNLQFPDKENELRKNFFDALDKELPIVGQTSPPTITSDQENVVKRKVDSDQVIAKAQKKLSLLGYDPGPADGISGKKTRNALKQFQQSNGLAVTGKADKETMDKLLKSPETGQTDPGTAPSTPKENIALDPAVESVEPPQPLFTPETTQTPQSADESAPSVENGPVDASLGQNNPVSPSGEGSQKPNPPTVSSPTDL